MKKLLSLLLAALLLMSMTVMPALADGVTRIGELTWLNNDEAVRMAYMENLVNFLSNDKDPTVETLVPKQYQVVEYDNLNSMLMGLTSGQIDEMMLYFVVGAYLCSQNDGIYLELTSPSYSPNANPALIAALTDVYKGTDFCFVMLDSQEALRDEFNEAIQAMTDDGTIYEIIEQQITMPIMGEEITPVTIEKIDGAETIRVAVTGDLPPIDYIAADGTPAGFNTAVLAEISKRLGKNIELVSIDAGGRATALASGAVDVVFWARINTPSDTLSSNLTEDEVAMVQNLKAAFDNFRSAEDDIPASTIHTVPYYHDIFVNVVKE